MSDNHFNCSPYPGTLMLGWVITTSVGTQTESQGDLGATTLTGLLQDGSTVAYATVIFLKVRIVTRIDFMSPQFFFNFLCIVPSEICVEEIKV